MQDMQEQIIEDKPLYRRGYEMMQQIFIREFALSHKPVAIKYFYNDIEVEYFKKWHSYEPIEKQRSFTDCIEAARDNGSIFLILPQFLEGDNDLIVFSFKEGIAKERLQKGVLAIAVVPFEKAQFVVDTAHFYVDETTKDKILEKWEDIAGIGPIVDNAINSHSMAAVAVHNINLAFYLPDAGTQNSLGFVIIPGDHLKHLKAALEEGKVGLGASPLSHPGDGFFRFTLG